MISGPDVESTFNLTHSIQSWPGEFDISGIELTDKFQEQAKQNSAILNPSIVTQVDFSKLIFIITIQEPFQNNLKTIKAQTCIIALGSYFNRLNVP